MARMSVSPVVSLRPKVSEEKPSERRPRSVSVRFKVPVLLVPSPIVVEAVRGARVKLPEPEIVAADDKSMLSAFSVKAPLLPPRIPEALSSMSLEAPAPAIPVRVMSPLVEVREALRRMPLPEPAVAPVPVMIILPVVLLISPLVTVYTP